VWRDFVLGTLHDFSDFEFSLAQVATLFLLDEEGEQPIKFVAMHICRSVSATGRMIDHLVKRGFVSRREDERDRRVKRVSITGAGRDFIHAFEQRRADAQFALMEYLSEQERAEVVRAMLLISEAGIRRQQNDHLDP
jgi:DNA-binding MarR family transcriptional regulator